MLLHSIKVLVSTSVEAPNINLSASWSVLKSNDTFDLVALLYLSILVLVSVNSILPPILTLFVKLVPSAVKLETDKSFVILTLPDGFKSKSTTLSSDVAFDIFYFLVKLYNL